MNEDLFPVKLPPGLFKNGTRYQAAGRWYDANLIRFQGDTIQPWGGWRAMLSAAGGSLTALTGAARGIHAWASDSGSVKVGIGTHNRAYVLIDGTVTDITPAAGFAGTDINSALAGGGGAYGSGPYGAGAYGSGSVLGAIDDADTWSLDNFGDQLVGCLTEDGKIYVWDGNTANDFAQAAGSPTSCTGLVVTPDRFLVALGAGGNKRKVQWPDRETTTVWTPAATNRAGSFELATNGRLLCGARTTRETLLWTDADVWAMTFIGGTLVHSFRQAGDKCGIIGKLAKAVVGTKAYWMGKGVFYQYDGNVRELKCDVDDYVFSDINEVQFAKIWAMTFAEFGEVVWFYCSAGSIEIDRYVVYNYRENHWNAGRLQRVCGTDRGAASYPILLQLAYAAQGTLTSTGVNVSNGNTVTINGKVYTFQTVLTNVDGNVLIGANAAASLTNLYNAINLGPGAGSTYAAATTLHPTVEAVTLTSTTIVVRAKASGTSGNALTTAESAATLSWGGATLAGGGDSTNGYAVSDLYEHEVANDRGTDVAYLESGPYEIGDQIMGIYRLVPDERNLGDTRLYVYTSLSVNPGASETLNGPYTSTAPTDVRLTARYMRLRIEEFVKADWRLGRLRVGARQKGRR